MDPEEMQVERRRTGEEPCDATIGAKVPKDWIDEIDEIVKEQGLSNRSEFLRRVLEPIVNEHREAKKRAERALTDLLATEPPRPCGLVLTRIEDANGTVTWLRTEREGK